MPTTPPEPVRRTPSHRRIVALVVAYLAVLLALDPVPASAAPLAESFRQWSQRRQTRSHVEKPFSHQSSKVDLSVHPSVWSKLRSSGMASAMKGATAAKTAAQGNHSSVVGKLRDRLSPGDARNSSGFQQTTEPIHHDQGMISR